jgi:hypothetical protein
MVAKQPVDDTKYAGPSKAIEILGRGHAYGWIGSVVGLIGGAGVAAVSTREPGEFTHKTTAALKKFGLKVDGKWAMVAAGALAGWQVMHYVSLLVGMRVAANQVGAGEEQFKRLSSKCKSLEAELNSVKTEKKAEALPKDDAPLTTIATDDVVESRGVSPDTLTAQQVNGR